MAHYIETALGTRPPIQLIESVFTQTEGNPLSVTEVVRLLAQEETLAAAGENPSATSDGATWNLRIPEGVREVIGRRLNRLSTDCNDTLSVASIIGREFSLSQLRSLFEQLTEDQLLEMLEEALEARVIEELPSEAELNAPPSGDLREYPQSRECVVLGAVSPASGLIYC